jgi:hypothetical protein
MAIRRIRPVGVGACALMVVLGCRDAAAELIRAQNGRELQAAIDRARPGDTIALTAGQVYSGNFVLPVKSGSEFITIQTGDATRLLPGGMRVSPRHSGKLAIIQSSDRQPALRTAPGAHHWRLETLEFRANHEGAGDIITLGDGGSAQRDLTQVPKHLVIDRCYIHGDPVQGQKRGIALNSGETTIINSYISDIKARGVEAQAIAGWNGPGPYTIENNYLEGSGQSFMLGGADPAITGLVTADVVFRRNHLSKPIEWRDDRWTEKNLFELKNARRVLVEGNLIEYSWVDGQVGYAIVLTPANQDGRAPWATVEDVTFRNNVIRHAGGGMQIIGENPDRPSGPTKRITVSNNLFYDIDTKNWGGSGAFILIGNGPSDVVVEHNTVYQSGNILMAYGESDSKPKPITGVRFRDNIIRHNQYGVHGTGRGVGDDTLRAYFPGIVFTSNAIAGGNAKGYPSGNTFVSEEDWETQFLNVPEGDFRLRPNSRFRKAASDGKDLGADIGAIAIAMGLRPGARIP